MNLYILENTVHLWDVEGLMEFFGSIMTCVIYLFLLLCISHLDNSLA